MVKQRRNRPRCGRFAMACTTIGADGHRQMLKSRLVRRMTARTVSRHGGVIENNIGDKTQGALMA